MLTMQFDSVGFKTQLNQVNAPADVTDFLGEIFERARKKSGRNYAEA